MNRINGAIRSAIYSLEMTQKELADEMGITQPSLNRLMNQNNRIQPEMLERLLRAACNHSRKLAVIILLEHLRDEVDRSGLLPAEIPRLTVDQKRQRVATRATQLPILDDLIIDLLEVLEGAEIRCK